MIESLSILGESAGFGIEVESLIAQIINFTGVTAALYYFAFKPVLKTLDERQKEISDGLQYAEEMKEKLAETDKKQQEVLREANQQAQEILSDARKRAKEHLDKELQAASNKVEDLLAKGREANEKEREQMISEVKQEIAKLVVLTSGQVLSKSLTEDEKNRFAEAATKELVELN